MKFIRKTLPLLAAVLALSAPLFRRRARSAPILRRALPPDEIIQKFSAKEKEFKEARDNYTFRQNVKVQTLDGDTVTGEYSEVFDVTYDNQGTSSGERRLRAAEHADRHSS